MLLIEQSTEYRIDEVTQLYAQMLNRAPDIGGLTADLQALESGATMEQLKTAIAGSPEYFQVRADGNVTAFLDALYHDGLGRPLDSLAQFQDATLLANGDSRAQVAAVIFGSSEYQNDLVSNYYLTKLHRPAELDADNWVFLLQQGGTDEQVLAGIVGSAEYFAATQQ